MSDSSWDFEEDDTEDIASGLAAILGPRGSNMPPEFLERHVTGLFNRLSPADSESFTNALKRVGQFATSNEVRGVAASALPIAGTAVGTIYGGPLGASVGSKLGGAAAQAIGPSGGRARPAAPAAPAATTTPAQQGSASAAQLLSVVQNPTLLSSLLALAMGQNGRTSVPLAGGDREVPVGAMVNLVRELAERTAEDAEEILAAEGDAMADYLYDESGCLACDPAVSSQRADALLRVLTADAEAALEGDEDADDGEDWEGEDWDADDWDGDDLDSDAWPDPAW
jgi:hypothetical protein